MPQALADYLDRNAGLKKVRRGGVAQVVKSDVADAGDPDNPLPGTLEAAGWRIYKRASPSGTYGSIALLLNGAGTKAAILAAISGLGSGSNDDVVLFFSGSVVNVPLQFKAGG